jgi:hypothetical protein
MQHFSSILGAGFCFMFSLLLAYFETCSFDAARLSNKQQTTSNKHVESCMYECKDFYEAIAYGWPLS